MLFYRALDREVTVRFSQGANDFFLFQKVPTGSEANTVTVSVQRVKRPVRKADQSLHQVAEIRMSGAIPPLSHVFKLYTGKTMFSLSQDLST